MKTHIFLFLLMFMMTQIISGQAPPPPIEAGVSQSLAKWRAANYSDVRYGLNITLEKGASLMKGEIEIRVNLTETGAKNDLILDWRTTQFANDKDKPFAEVVAVNEMTGAQAARLHERDSAKKPSITIDSIRFQTPFRRYRAGASEPLALQSDGASEPLAFQSNEHLIIPKKFLKTGENIIKIEFASPIKTSGGAITRYVDKEDGAEYIYSLFVPSDASTAFPVFDQPDLKARFQMNAIIPRGWKIISNTNLLVTKPITLRQPDEKRDGTSGETIITPLDEVEFKETKPISTYVFAFAAGDFVTFREGSTKTVEEEFKNATLPEDPKELVSQLQYLADDPNSKSHIYIRKSQAEKFKQHAAEVFRLNREGVKFLESWFDYKFPFPKYDLVLIPEFPFGGMEHAGATFLREDRIIFPTEPTKNDLVTRANVIFHEAAHQWFGDTVTMKWFDDLWLKEGFAEFMAYKTLEKVMPEYNAWKIFYERNKQAAYLTDITRGTTPIYQEISNLSAAKSAYGNIVYRKAPSFLKQAEFFLGEKEFQTAVRAFLKKHEFGNAGWQDLVNEFESVSKQDLKTWAEDWVRKPGLPKISNDINTIDEINYPNDKSRSVTSIVFSQHDDPLNYWTMKTKVLVELDDGIRKEQIISFSRAKSVIEYLTNTDKLFTERHLVLDKSKTVKFVFPNYQDYGYGIFLLDEKSRAFVLENIQNEKDDFLRSMMWGALWDSLRFYELAPEDYVKLVIKNINVESDESTISTLLGRASTAMNYYLPDEQAKQFAPNLENLLLEKMQTAPTLGLRITYYRSFLNIASSEKARMFLKEMLKNTGRNPNVNEGAEILGRNPNVNEGAVSKIESAPSITVGFLPLKSKDKFDIVTRLIILGDADGLKLLAELEKTETDDAAKRYAYAARAGIPTAENKAKFWKDFTENKEISESWIESAFGVWNSPRHADLTLPYLEKALAELPNLKKNRKIFFVNGWLSSFIGGQRSAEALKVVNNFLEKNPNLDRDLRLKILENVDGLERAVKIRAKYVGKN